MKLVFLLLLFFSPLVSFAVEGSVETSSQISPMGFGLICAIVLTLLFMFFSSWLSFFTGLAIGYFSQEIFSDAVELWLVFLCGVVCFVLSLIVRTMIRSSSSRESFTDSFLDVLGDSFDFDSGGGGGLSGGFDGGGDGGGD